MEVTEHSKNKYIERILGIDFKSEEGENMRDLAEQEIKLIVSDPDRVYHGKKDMPPIYIRGDAAVPVCIDEDTWVFFIPTCYSSETFKNKGQQNHGAAGLS